MVKGRFFTPQFVFTICKKLNGENNNMFLSLTPTSTFSTVKDVAVG